ncbi:hypothetical protein [Brevundimonas sp.]|uniref:hypothetical protein n=1 Tax=Brevundimonas sp. TaxID=1871086 RepID=UPI00286BB453|nr:hypothetical protein [Brevundimonas sp.]
MPDVSTTEWVVTGYVNENFSGSYTDSQFGNGSYRNYDSNPDYFWFDTDGDGWFDYGRLDVGFGEWWTFDGFQWKNANGEVMETVYPRGAKEEFSAGIDDVVIASVSTDGDADSQTALDNFGPNLESMALGIADFGIPDRASEWVL